MTMNRGKGISRRDALIGSAAAAAGVGLTHEALAKPLADVLSAKKLRAGINPTLPPFGVFNRRTRSTASTPTSPARSRGR